MSQPLNPQHLMYFADMAWAWATVFLPRLAAAIAILAAGFIAAGWFERMLRRLLTDIGHIDPTLKPILAALARYAVLIVVFVAALSQLGFQTASLLAVLGAAGLAIGLALQGTLSNIAAGIMLLWLRPFRVGDYIEVGSQGGAVEEIGLFACKLRTFDGLFLFAPNSAIWNTPLKNHTRNGGRLVNLDITVPAGADLGRLRRILAETAAETPGVQRLPEPRVFVENLAGGALIVGLTVWTTPTGAGDAARSIVERVKAALDALGEGFEATQITRTIPADTDPARFLATGGPAVS